MNNQSKFFLVIILMATFLTSLDWGKVTGLTPPWLLVACLYIVCKSPLKFGLVFALVMGFYNDILNLQVIGVDGSLFCLSAYLVRLVCWYLNHTDQGILAIFLSLIVGTYLILNFLVSTLLGELVWQHFNGLEIFTATMLSCGLFLLLNQLNQKISH